MRSPARRGTTTTRDGTSRYCLSPHIAYGVEQIPPIFLCFRGNSGSHMQPAVASSDTIPPIPHAASFGTVDTTIHTLATLVQIADYHNQIHTNRPTIGKSLGLHQDLHRWFHWWHPNRCLVMKGVMHHSQCYLIHVLLKWRTRHGLQGTDFWKQNPERGHNLGHIQNHFRMANWYGATDNPVACSSHPTITIDFGWWSTGQDTSLTQKLAALAWWTVQHGGRDQWWLQHVLFVATCPHKTRPHSALSIHMSMFSGLAVIGFQTAFTSNPALLPCPYSAH